MKRLSNLIIVEPGTMSQPDKEKIEALGAVVIEHPDPDKVKLLTPSSKIFTNDLLMSALHAIEIGNDISTQRQFVKELNLRLKKNENK
jgi:cysteine synthase